MTFKYILIPADSSSAVVTKEESSEGGLNNDLLIKRAKEYFSAQGGSSTAATMAMIDNASTEERKAIASQIRKNTPGCEKFDDDFLIQMFKTTQSQTSCEIHAMVVPKPSNQHIGVSMYSADNAKTRNLPANHRAMELMKACGHAVNPTENPICGDVFVGRYHDDEARDIWNRIDFTEEDLKETSEWCIRAKQSGGGGGLGAAAPSLSGMMTKSISNGFGAGGNVSNGDGNGNGNGNGENGGNWTQTSEEVELKFQVASGTKAKYVKVAFGRSTLKVTVAGQTLISGTTGGEVAVDDSTYTLQDGGGGKELAVTLGKKKEGIAWEYAVQSK